MAVPALAAHRPRPYQYTVTSKAGTALHVTCLTRLLSAVVPCKEYQWLVKNLRIQRYFMVQGMAARGTLAKLTVNDLKKYCEVHQLPKSGKKDDIVQRILQHVQKT